MGLFSKGDDTPTNISVDTSGIPVGDISLQSFNPTQATTVGNVPGAPDLSGVIAAIKEASQFGQQTAKDQLAWAKEQFAGNQEISDEVVSRFLGTQDELNQNAREDRERYENTYRPLEDRFIDDANNYDSSARREAEAGKAQAGVGQAFDAARNSAVRNLESYGVNPASTRFAALDIGTRMQEAASKAGAGNAARDNVENKGLALRREAIGLGQNLPGQSLASNAAAMNAGTGAVNTGLATTASGAASMGTGAQWAGIGNAAAGQLGDTINSGFKNELGAYDSANKYGQSATQLNNDAAYKAAQLANEGALKEAQLRSDSANNAAQINSTNQYNSARLNQQAEQNSSSGLGSMLGLGMSALTSTIPGGSILGQVGSRLFAAEGGAIDDPAATPGGAIPMDASPSQGAAVDDVSAQLTAGEFVIPKDVTSWFGEKYFQNMIVKAREAKSKAGAKPAIGAAPPQQQEPTFRSRPGAIPMAEAA